MDTKKLRNFDQNLIDLLKDAHKWEYTEINDNKEKSLQKKPKLFFTCFQWVLVLLSVGCTILCPNGLSSNFAGYIISGMSLFVGLLFTLVVSLFDKFNDMVCARVRVEPLAFRLPYVADKLLVCSAYLLADDYFSALNSLVVFNYRIVVFRIALHIITSFVYPAPERR